MKTTEKKNYQRHLKYEDTEMQAKDPDADIICSNLTKMDKILLKRKRMLEEKKS